MAFIKIFVPFATLILMAYCSEIGIFYLTYSFATLDVPESFRNAWEFCPENTTNQESYESVLEETRFCYKNVTYGNNSICQSFKKRVQKCFLPLVDFFIGCFPETAKDLPPAISKAATAVVEAFCTSSGDLLLEALNPCLYEYGEHENNNTKKECRRENIADKLEKLGHDIPSKIEACHAFQEIGDCWKDYLDQTCGNLASKNLFSKLYNAALTPCK